MRLVALGARLIYSEFKKWRRTNSDQITRVFLLLKSLPTFFVLDNRNSCCLDGNFWLFPSNYHFEPIISGSKSSAAKQLNFNNLWAFFSSRHLLILFLGGNNWRRLYNLVWCAKRERKRSRAAYC